jgi:hypothetical protein
MTWEVIDLETGARMSHQSKGDGIMGTTLFDSEVDAVEWVDEQGLQDTHFVRPTSEEVSK